MGCRGPLIPPYKRRLLNIYKFCKPVVKLLVVYYQPPKKYLQQGNSHLCQSGPCLFVCFEESSPAHHCPCPPRMGILGKVSIDLRAHVRRAGPRHGKARRSWVPDAEQRHCASLGPPGVRSAFLCSSVILSRGQLCPPGDI